MNPRHVVLVASWIGLMANVAAGQQPPPAAAFASLPVTELVCMSPDGQKLAWANASGSIPEVSIYDIAANRHLRRVQMGKYAVRHLAWSDNRTLIITISETVDLKPWARVDRKYEFYRYLALDADGGEARSLLMEIGASRP